MEPFQRRSLGNVPPRRPIINTPPMRQQRIGKSITPTQPSSVLRPPTAPSMEVRPAAAPAQQHTPAPYVPQPIPSVAHPPMQPTPGTAPAAAAHLMPATPIHATPTSLTPPAHQNLAYGAAPIAVPTAASSVISPTPAGTPLNPTAAQPAHEHPPVKSASDHAKPHRLPHSGGHAGLIGLAVFVVFGALFFAPLLPGKIWSGAPGSSQSFSTGDQNIDCLGTLGKLSTVTRYNTKVGFPLVYNYTTTSTISASCGGKIQHATGGHTSQFNPLAVLINGALALAIAIVTAKIWRKIRASRD
jgi:hypothetical protein